MKRIITFLWLTIFAFDSKAQDLEDWIGPYTFEKGQHICDTSNWKLVFVDHFNGNALDSSLWITFKSWNGMFKQLPNGKSIETDHEYWTEARYESGGQYIFRKENIEVNNGTAKLKIKHEPNSWNSGNEIKQMQYSSAALCTYYKYEGKTKSFNSGKFEFRVKLPNFPYSFGTAWTWFGNGMGVNEIDMAESSGPNKSGKPDKSMWKSFNWKTHSGTVNHPTHAWGWEYEKPKPPYVQPFHKKMNVVQNQTPYFPGQTWWNYLSNTFIKINDWHTYTIEWDSTQLKTYFDGELTHTLPKYYTNLIYPKRNNSYQFKAAASCNLEGTYQVTKGFPYRIESASQLRFTTGVGSGIPIDTSQLVYDLGEMEIDYVKIWQRQIQKDHEAIKDNNSALKIEGSQILKDQDLYFVDKKFKGGVWRVNNDAAILFPQKASNKIILAANPKSKHQNFTLSYTYNSGNDTIFSTHVNVQNSVVQPIVLCNRIRFEQSAAFLLKVANPLPDAQYHWKLQYQIDGKTYLEHYVGNVCITNAVPQLEGKGYQIHWALSVRNQNTTLHYEGLNNETEHQANIFAQGNYINSDSGIFYLEAQLNAEDSVQFEYDVATILDATYITDVTDTIALHEHIANAYLNSLEPYLDFDNIKEAILLPSNSNAIKGWNIKKKYPKPIPQIEISN